MKKNYNVDSIYFGNLVYNTGSEGYYYTSTQAFEKIDDDSYKVIKNKGETIVKCYQVNTKKYLTVVNLFPLSKLVKDKEISSSKLKLYLMKYCISNNKNKSLFPEYENKVKKNK